MDAPRALFYASVPENGRPSRSYKDGARAGGRKREEKTPGEKERCRKKKKNEGMQLGKALRNTRLSITEEARDVTSPLRIPPGTRAPLNFNIKGYASTRRAAALSGERGVGRDNEQSLAFRRIRRPELDHSLAYC